MSARIARLSPSFARQFSPMHERMQRKRDLPERANATARLLGVGREHRNACLRLAAGSWPSRRARHTLYGSRPARQASTCSTTRPIAAAGSVSVASNCRV